jgi:hypothetical protein
MQNPRGKKAWLAGGERVKGCDMNPGEAGGVTRGA